MKNVISSPLISSFNTISSVGESKKSLTRFKKRYNDFFNFLQIKKVEIDNLKLPEKRKISQLSNLNLTSTFGKPGNLLAGLFSGSLNAAQFLGSMFPGVGKIGAPKSTKGIPSPKPIKRGPKLKIGGLRSIGVVNALFAGLDFATGLQEGEGIGKAAAGAGGSLAGSLLGGAIGQALVPIPGVGFVLGSMAGGFLGGWAADRAVETASGTKGGVSQKLKERLKKQEEQQKTNIKESKSKNIISKFDESVSKFEKIIYTSFASVINAVASATGSDEMMMDYGLDPNEIPSSPELPGELPEMTAEGGELPSSKPISSPYGMRWGRLHSGVDYPRRTGTPVSVIQPGQVSYSGELGGYGNTVIISHPGGLSTLYGHLDTINVKNGQSIEPGTVIGTTGSTGRSTGPHVHFEVRRGGGGINIPNNEGDKYFRFGGNVKAKPKAGNVSGKPTAVLMAGTNDYGNARAGAAGVRESIKALQDKGYNVIVVPPSEVGQTSAVSKAIQQVASEMGATVRKGQYKQTDNSGTIPYAHLTDASAREIANQYRGATFVGDSNAQLIPGSKIASPGSRASSIAEQIRTFIPMAQVRPGVGGPELTQEMISAYNSGELDNIARDASYYPSYNQPQSTVTIMPIMMGNTGGSSQKPVYIPVGGGGGSVILPGPSQGQMVNSLMKTMLLTTLSSV